PELAHSASLASSHPHRSPDRQLGPGETHYTRSTRRPGTGGRHHARTSRDSTRSRRFPRQRTNPVAREHDPLGPPPDPARPCCGLCSAPFCRAPFCRAPLCRVLLCHAAPPGVRVRPALRCCRLLPSRLPCCCLRC